MSLLIDRVKNLWRTMVAKEVVIVYQMGKVGSTALYQALKQDADVPVFHLHRFSLRNLSFVNRGPRKTLQRQAWASLLFWVLCRKRLKLVCLVRDPIKRNVSDFFQTLTYFMRVEKIERDALDAQRLRQMFLLHYPHTAPLNWFDLQVKQLFGIDVYCDPFSTTENGLRLWERGRVSLCVCRSEELDQCVADISAFVGTSLTALPPANRGDRKWYGDLYQEFKQLPLPEWYAQMMQDSRYWEFFYGSRAQAKQASLPELTATSDRERTSLPL